MRRGHHTETLKSRGRDTSLHQGNLTESISVAAAQYQMTKVQTQGTGTQHTAQKSLPDTLDDDVDGPANH